MKSIPDVSESLAQLSHLSEQISEAVVDRYQRLEVLTKEKASLMQMPVQRDDYIAYVCAQIDVKAEFYKSALVREFEKELALPLAGKNSWTTATVANIAREKNDSPCLPGSLRGMPGGRDVDSEPLKQLAATYLMRDQMKHAAAEAINAIEPWPYPNAESMEVAVRRIKAIDSEMLTIESELSLLKTDADKIGLSLPAQPVRVMPIERGSWEWLQHVNAAAEARRSESSVNESDTLRRYAG